ncbi:MAG: laccase domain-containing protein, partial [Firmicutes bacterium]|nr:laccase domain-containing protein [Bacillota bacterium]
MERIKKGELEYLIFPSLEKTGLVCHAFSTRHGGVSEGVYESMNLTLRTGDAPE